jgi:C1A family cysteine protease
VNYVAFSRRDEWAEEGYFIVKNSWGTDSGDCGFYYLDYGYDKGHAF